MFNKLKEIVKDGLENGFRLPSAKDGESGKPSVTLWFAHVSFTVAMAGTIYFLATGDTLHSVLTAIGFWTIAMIWYRLRRLDSVKIDLRDQEIELNIDSDNKNEKND